MTGELPAWIEVGLHIAEVIGGIAGAVAMITMAMARRTFASKAEMAEKFETHEGRHETLDRRLADGDRVMATLRSDIEHLPDHGDLNELKDSIGQIAEGVAALTATMEALKDQMKGVQGSFEKLLYHQMDREHS